jgi:acetoin utilization protein AcuB
MQTKVHSVKPRDSITHAREIMEKHRVNQLPVVRNGRLLGIITDRDLRDAFPSALYGGHDKAAGAHPDDTPVEEVMTPNVLSLTPQDSIATAAETMRGERIGAIPIVEKEKLVGILTRSDILRAFVDLLNRIDSKDRPL